MDSKFLHATTLFQIVTRLQTSLIGDIIITEIYESKGKIDQTLNSQKAPNETDLITSIGAKKAKHNHQQQS